MTRRRQHLLAGALLAAVLCVFFWPLLIGDQLTQSQLLYSDDPWRSASPGGLDAPRSGAVDMVLEYHPILSVARDQIHDGRLPLWNPYSYAGMPLLGDMQSALLYPLTWIAIVLPLEDGLGLVALLKLLVAGLGAYALARQLRVGFGGALLAGVVYMLAAPNIVWLQWPLGTVFSLFPWLLLATDRLYRRPGPREVAALAAVVGLSILAGHPETAFLSTSAAAVYLIALTLADPGARPRLRELARHGARFVAANALGAALAAVVVLPFLDAYSDSITRESHDVLSKGHLPLWSSLIYWLPNVFGDGKPEYWGPPLSYLIVAAYFGVAALLLAGLALVRNRRNPAAVALTAAAAVAFMVAFGVPPVRWLVENVYPYSSGNNSRVHYIVALAGAIGAGAGFESLARKRLPLRRVALGAGAALAVFLSGLLLALALGHLPAPVGVEARAIGRFAVAFALGTACLALVGRVRRGVALAIVLAVAAADLAYLQSYNVMLPPDKAYPPRPAVADALQRDREPFRVRAFRTALEQPNVMRPNTSALYEIENTQGYDYPQSRRWADFAWFVLGERGITREIQFLTPGPPRGPALTALRMMNTRYYLAGPGAAAPDPSFEPVYRGRDATVFRDPEALPRAYVVPRVRPLADGAALDRLVRGGLDPRSEALVPEDAPRPAGAGGMRPARAATPSEDRVRVSVPQGDAGWLVLANGWWGQWKAKVDGRDAKVYPTNYAAMGVPLPAGAHTVEFRVRRTSFVAGAAISGAALALLLALVAAPAVRRRRP